MAQFQDILKSEPYQELVEAVASGAVAFIGAGSSARLGYPAWDNLLQQLDEEASRLHPDNPDLPSLRKSRDGLVRADHYRTILGENRFSSFIKLTYGPKSPQYDQFHRDIIEAPFSNLLTTNYDLVLEEAATAVGQNICSFDFDDASHRAEFVLNCRKPERHIAHLHGSVRNPAGVVLSLADYRKVYDHETALRKAVDIVLAPSQVVFIGFSLADEYFMRLLDSLGTILGAGDPRHFALLPSPQDGNEATPCLDLKRFLIKPIFYDPSLDHKALADLVALLRKDANQQKRKDELRRDSETIRSLFPSGDAAINRTEALERLRTLRSPLGPSRGLAGQGWTEGETIQRTPLDEDIDAAFLYVKHGQPQVTVSLLQDMLVQRAAPLDNRLRYRIYANIGSAQYASEQPDLAAEAYLEAVSFRPDHKEARAFEALAHQLRKDFTHAYALSIALCQEYPDYARAHAIRIRSASENYSFAEARSSVPRSARRDVEVASALSGLAMDEGKLRICEAYARIAAQSGPAWPEAMINLAAVILMREKQTAFIDIRRGLIPRSPERVTEARKLLSEALDVLMPRPGKQLKAICLYNRSSGNRLLGDLQAAQRDLQDASHLQPEDPTIAASMALGLAADGKASEAIITLEQRLSYVSDPKTSFTLALLLHERKQPGDLDRVIALLQPLVEQLTEIKGERLPSAMVAILTKSLVDNGQTHSACELLEQVKGLHEGTRRAILATLLFGKNNEPSQEQARQLIREAHAQAAQSNDQFAMREVANCAEHMGEHSIAFKLRKQFVSTPVWSYDASTLLRVARKTAEDAFILQFCEQLRQSGIHEPEAFRIEADALLRCHEFPRAIALMQEWLRLHPDDWEVRLNLSIIGINIDRPDIVVSEPSLLPTVKQVQSVEQGATVVSILTHYFGGTSSAQYAYDLWRRFPNDMTAQHSLICAVIGPIATPLSVPDQVESDSAVTIQEMASRETKTFIIETVNPSAQLREFPPTHPVVTQLMGKREGDDITIEGRPASIMRVENKIAFRARQCLGDFDEVFPDNRLLHRFEVADDLSKAPDIRTALGSVWEVLDAQEKRQQAIETIYGCGSLPVPTFAKALGKSVLETICYLAEKRNATIWVSEGTDEEWGEATEAIKQETVVLDETAVSTLFLLELHDRLGELPFKCIVPEAILQSIRNLLHQRRTIKPSGYLASIGGGLVFTEASPEQEAKWIRRLEGLLRALGTHCEVVGGQARLSLAASDRELLVNSLGFGTTDAIATAKQLGVPLWTDDYIISSRICAKLGASRVWTQLVLDSAEAVLGSAAQKATQKLLLSGYNFTRLNMASVIDIFRRTKWNPKHNDSRQVLAYLGEVGACGGQNAALTQLLLVRLWSQCRNRQKAGAMIVAILEAVGRDAAARMIARPLYRLRGKPRPVELCNPHFRSLRRLLRRWRSCGGFITGGDRL